MRASRNLTQIPYIIPARFSYLKTLCDVLDNLLALERPFCVVSLLSAVSSKLYTRVALLH
jgi:hypothetical protein